jgi:hypothetical protein
MITRKILSMIVHDYPKNLGHEGNRFNNLFYIMSQIIGYEGQNN